MHIEHSYLYRLFTSKWVLLCVLPFLSFLTIDDGHSWGDDFALYVSQAISIVNGTTHQLFETNKFAMDYSDRLTGPYLYPVGTSLCLTPIIKLLGANFYAMKMVMLLFWIGSPYVIHSFFLIRTGDKTTAAFITICFGLHPQMVILPDTIGSDIPFLFFTFLFFMVKQKNSSSNIYILYTQLVIIVFIAYLFRSIGLLLLPLISLVQLNHLKNYSIKKNILLLSFPYLVFFILMKALSMFYKIDSGSYLDYLQLTDIPTILNNIRYYIELFATYPFNLWELIIPHISAFSGIAAITFFFYVTSFVTFGISMYGIYSKFKENFDLIVCTAIIMGLYSIWPSKQGYRFIIPLLPIYIYFLWIGCKQLMSISNVKITRILPALIVSLISVSGLLCVIQFTFFKNTDAIHTTNSKELYTFIETQTDSTDILCFFKPRALRLETGRNAIRQLTDEYTLTHSKANYYVSYRSPMIQYKSLQEVFKNSDFVVYKINR